MSTAPVAVLYEDNHVIVVCKPAGRLVQGDSSGERTLLDDVKDWIAHKYNKPGNVFLGLVHRLDRSVTGVIMFARTSKGAARLSEQVRDRTVRKTYCAWVEGVVTADQTLVHWMSSDDGYVKVHERDGPDRKKATLHLKVLRHERDRSLLEIDLETGRKHQIRAQLAAFGHPIVGDERYGAKTRWSHPGIALAAVRLQFKHPTKDELIDVKLPDEMNPLLRM